MLPRLEGAFSFVLMDEGHVVGVRDPHGFRPLCLGLLDQGGWVLASETPALDVVGAHFVRELEPGEMVVIDADGVRSERPFPAERRSSPSCACSSSSTSPGPTRPCTARACTLARCAWASRWPIRPWSKADLVIGVPDSGVPAAEGFAEASGIPFGHGLVKNRYIGRTFIAPSQEMRALGVRMKLNPLRDNIDGRRIVVVDDSVVRGTTTRAIVRMLREAGAAEVHLRLTSPPVRWPCFYGIDTPNRDELLAANMSVEEIRDYLGVDTTWPTCPSTG